MRSAERASFPRPARAAAALTIAFGVSACGPTDGSIGVSAPPRRVGETPTFEAEYANADSLWQAQAPIERASADVGDANADARDSRVATLVLPGHTEYGAGDALGPDRATALSSSGTFGYGLYRFRIAFGACQTNEEAAQAALGYFNDGLDHDGNSITDDVEIDFQVLCGSPARAYLTVFTDYEASGGNERFRKLSRIVDFASGQIYETKAPDLDEFVNAGRDTSLSLSGALSPRQFHELGFEWHQDSIRFFLAVGGADRTLWTLNDPGRVPKPPVRVIYNLWHPESHWFPLTGSADFPAEDVVMQIDWFRFYAER